MATTTFTTDVAVVYPQFSDGERYALAAFLAGYRGLTRDAYAWTFASSSSGARNTTCGCSTHAGRTSSVSLAI
jgi:hypothetical protein